MLKKTEDLVRDVVPYTSLLGTVSHKKLVFTFRHCPNHFPPNPLPRVLFSGHQKQCIACMKEKSTVILFWGRPSLSRLGPQDLITKHASSQLIFLDYLLIETIPISFSQLSCSWKVEYFNGHLRLWANSRDFILFRLTALQPINVTLSKELQVFGNSQKSCCLFCYRGGGGSK